MLRMRSIVIGWWLPGSVLSQDLYIGITCAILKNWGNTPGVISSIIISESKGDKRHLIDLIIFVEYVEIFELLFLKDEILFSICSKLTSEK